MNRDDPDNDSIGRSADKPLVNGRRTDWLKEPPALPKMACGMLLFVGISVLFWTGLVVLLGKVEVNKRLISYNKSPHQFITVVAVALGVSCGCLLIAWLSFLWHKKREEARAGENSSATE